MVQVFERGRIQAVAQSQCALCRAVKGTAVFSSPGGSRATRAKGFRAQAVSYKAPLYVTLRSPSGKIVR